MSIEPITQVKLPFVSCRDAILPPAELRFCGDEFQDNEYFLKSARNEAIRLVEHFGLSKESSVLDIGCGAGRLPIGIIEHMGDIYKYRGIDVCEITIGWCQQYITPFHPSYQFIYLNVENARYNFVGRWIDDGFSLPFGENEFDILNLYSVFSHMAKEHVKIYLKDFRRILKPGGKIFLTAFIEEDVPEMIINPEDYRMNWSGPLHCVRYDESYFRKLLSENGFNLDLFDYEKETDGQSGLYISLREKE